MSEEIICLSSSDDENTYIENSANVKAKSKNTKQKRRLSDLAPDDKSEIKKQKICNGVIDVEELEDSEPIDTDDHKEDSKLINIDKHRKDSKSKLNLNLSNKKNNSNANSELGTKGEKKRKRSLSPIAGTSKYFDLIENQVPKKNMRDEKEKKLLPQVSRNSKTSSEDFSDESKTQQSTPTSDKSFKRIKPQLIIKEIVSIPDPSENIFEKIQETCRKKKSSDEMEIAFKKIKNYYDQLEPADKECEDFRFFLNSCLNKIVNANQIYKHLLDIKTEIIRRIKIKRILKEQVDKNKVSIESEVELTEDEARKVKKLEKVINEVKKKIEKLENQEVDFEEEDNSAYIKVDRYKKKLVELCNELSQITKDKMLEKQIHKRLLKRKDIPDEMTGIIYVDDAIIRFINSSIKKANELKHIKQPNSVASSLLMPDYVDILQCIKQCNEERNLELKNKKMEKLAEKAFKAVGNYLKKQRLQETKEYLASFVENSDGDPAKDNPDLSQILKHNKEVGTKKLEGIFAKFVAKQEGQSENSETENDENNSSESESNEEHNSTTKDKYTTSSEKEDNESSEEKSHSFDKHKRSNNNKKVIHTVLSDNKIEENNHQSFKENNKKDENKMNTENSDKTKLSTPEETSTPRNEVKESEPSKTINEVVTILSEICEINNSSTNNKTKPCHDSRDDEIEILSDVKDTNKENNELLENEYSQDIVLEIDDEDPLCITGDNTTNITTEKGTSAAVVKSVPEEKKKEIGDEFLNCKEKTEKKSTQNAEKINISEKKLKDNNDNDSSTISNENVSNVTKKTNVGKVYPLQTRDNGEKLVLLSDQSITTENSREETHKPSNKKVNSDDEIVIEQKELSFLKVKSFAKPPESWKDKSPEKPQRNPKLIIQQPIKQVLQQMSKPECVDLTNENEIRSSSTRFINPLALKKRRVPVNKLVVVKNVVNNFNFSLPADGVREKNRAIPVNKVQLVNPQVNKSILKPKATTIKVNQVPPNNHNQRLNQTSGSVKTSFVASSLKNKKSDNSNS